MKSKRSKNVKISKKARGLERSANVEVKKNRTGPRGKDSGSDEIRELILRAARKHFGMHGLGGASLKAIAKEAKVAGSLINYHFDSKEGLFTSCVEPLAKKRMEAITRILGEVRNYDEMRVRLELFVGEMLNSVVEDPFWFEIIDRELKAGQPIVLAIFEKTLLVAFNAVVGFLKDAQRRGLLKPDLDPLMVASLLFSSTCDVARKGVVAKKVFWNFIRGSRVASNVHAPYCDPVFKRSNEMSGIGLSP